MAESDRNVGKVVLVRALTKVQKERWQWLARRRQVPLAQLVRRLLEDAYAAEREAQARAAEEQGAA